MVPHRKSGRAGSATLRALSAAVVVAAVAAALALLRDRYVQDGELGIGLFAFERRLVQGFVQALPAALACAWLAAWLDRRPATSWRARAAVPALALVLGYLFASFQLPADAIYAPGFGSLRSLAVHGVALAAGVAAAWIVAPRTRLVPWPGAGAASRGPLVLAAAATLLLCAALVHARAPGTVRAAQGADPAAATPARPNVILISLDTLRADRLGCYGDASGTTPVLDRFAGSALRFEQAFTPQAWTLSAHMTMLTGLHPLEHGVDEERALASDIATVPERLHAAGYTTLGVADTCVWLDPRYGFARGFDLYRQLWDDADHKIDRLLHHLDNLRDEPVFVFAHFFDAHSDTQRLPYDASDDDRAQFADWYWGAFDGCEPELGCASEYLAAVNELGLELDPERRAWISSLYDAGVHTLDAKLGRLLAALEQRGLFETSWIVVTSDHGESFGEHGMLLHEQAYDECVRVPLLVRPPGGVAQRGLASGELVGLIDVAPTLLAAAGLATDGLAGRPLGPLALGAPARPAPAALAFALHERPVLGGLRGLRWSIVREGDGWHVFDLATDPGQQHPLAHDTLPADARELVASTARVEAELLARSRPGEAVPHPLGRDDLHALRALGYAGDEANGE